MKTKMTAIFLLLILASNSFAATRGYIIENRGFTFYAGIDEENVDVQLQLKHFTEVQEELMWKCVQDKDNYAILVESGVKSVKVPTEIPGRGTTVHLPEVYKVSCVRAPGFINHWRKQFNAAAVN